ncbi:MAG: SocA family protein [Candidatus Diapherotrites archaeon]|nr:SocA family protein [Candidatus Diapherotrites archaeon]
MSVTEKYKEVVHYIIQECQKSPTFGMTLLYKLLYFTDFDYYELNGTSITGTDYRRIPLGPAPCDIDIVLSQLKAEGAIKETRLEFSGVKQRRLIPLEPAKPEHLSAIEIKHIDNEIQKYSGWTARNISAFSHEDMPFKATEENELIDYKLVFYRGDKFSVRQEE